MKTHRKITGQTADGIPISEKIGPSREPRKAVIPADQEFSNLGGEQRKLEQRGMGLNPRRPSFERIEGEEE